MRSFSRVIMTIAALITPALLAANEDMKIGKDVKLNGTPTVLFNGSLFQSREKLQKSLKENK